ncbi:MAG: hypothetical protein HQK77_05990 [Desulfobacterales bacterium]|nr:hypothetical protein [Desulfobacterales bacterium]
MKKDMVSICGVLLIVLSLRPVFAEDVFVPNFAKDLKFKDYPVKEEKLKHVAAPKLDTHEARNFRTNLRESAKEGPNFAGHYRIAEWGCGTCCASFALINLKTGKVWFPPFFVSCCYPLDNENTIDDDAYKTNGEGEADGDSIFEQATLLYQKNSSLLIVIGSQNESPNCGVYYFECIKDTLKLLKTTHEFKTKAGY